MPLNFDNTYLTLPEHFYAKGVPETVTAARLLKWNHKLAKELGFATDNYSSAELAQFFSGNNLLEGSEPLAQAYAGHQFGGLSPQLGDGRAHLLGEVISTQGERLDIQLKGSGRTAFSRGGDGKATLYSVLREYLISEAMVALGIPSTRSLAVVASGETIVRDGLAVPSAVLTRVASSHIRVGTFQYFAIRGETESVKALADHTIARHYPEVQETENPYLALLAAVIDRQVHLISEWLRVGFIHGVMNTDNMTVSGETIDYGPCAFLDTYDPAAKFSSIDRRGRYAFANQAPIGHWNLARLAETLIGVIDEDHEKALEQVSEVLATYPEKFKQSYQAMMNRKLGLIETKPHTAEEDEQLTQNFLAILEQEQLDYTEAFRALTTAVEGQFATDTLLSSLSKTEPSAYQQWLDAWKTRIQAVDRAKSLSLMSAANPIYIPRNWHVEAALTSAAEQNEYSLFSDMLKVLQDPYTQQEDLHHYASTPEPSTSAYKTFCGT